MREKVCPHEPFAIGLRLSQQAAIELSEPQALLEFQRWLEKYSCYVFTINGFPFGQFHGTRVIGTSLCAGLDFARPSGLHESAVLICSRKLVPAGIEGSVSTVPGSFKEFISRPEQGS